MVSNNLWVGSLAGDVTDADLMSLFGKHGAIDSITPYSSRRYAFVHFKRAEDAKAAKDALQGAVLRGNALKIEFAKPAKQCKSLWVGGISASVTKEELEEQFLKFGKMQEFKFFREQNTAFVDYLRIEDATEALKNLNGKRIGGDQIHVDYLRSHHSRREKLPDFGDAREGQFLNRGLGFPDSLWKPQDFLRNYSEPAQYGSNRPQHFQFSGGLKGDGQPSNVLWVSYPPSFPIDEQMLHNAMILFGEIERIRTFPSENYSFVEFRSVEEAQRAKEGLQGQLFNDPRIIIMYSNRELALGKDQSVFYSGIRGPRPDMFLNGSPFRPQQMDIFSHNHSVVQNSFPGHLLPRGVTVPDMLRPLGPQGSFGPLLTGPEFNDLAKLHKLQDSNPNILVGGPNRKRLSPVPGVLSSPSPGMKLSRPVSGAWDVFDASQLQRESKRSRTGGSLDTLDPSLQKMDGRLDQFYGHGPQVDRGLSGAPPNVRGNNHFSPVDARVVSGGNGQGHPELDYIWRGVIAKGGPHVCRVRCVPVKIVFGFEIPEIVNCSARTGLDLLEKHYGDAIGFNIISFLPDSVDDFAPYTQFLRYLGAKNRAGVAKFDDGTTLFLVPPSDFLTNVLHVTGPERLYGVILEFPQHAPGSTSQHPPLANQQFIDIPMMLPRTENIMMPQEERVLQIDYNRVLENPNPPPKSMCPSSSNSFSELAFQPISTAAISQSGVTLTTELIATLASLLHTNGNSSGAEPVLLSSKLRLVLTPAATDRGQPQGWKHDQPIAPEQNGHPLDQTGNQYNPQGLFPSQLHYSVVSNTTSDSNQFQDSTFSMPQHGGIPSRQITTIAEPSQSRPQQYKVTPEESQIGYGQGFVTLSHHVHDATVSQQHIGIPVAGEYISLEAQNQVQAVQQLQSVLSGSDQGTSEVELDKNELYRSALQFAANLLHHVQKQHPDSEAGQGSVNY